MAIYVQNICSDSWYFNNLTIRFHVKKELDNQQYHILDDIGGRLFEPPLTKSWIRPRVMLDRGVMLDVHLILKASTEHLVSGGSNKRPPTSYSYC